MHSCALHFLNDILYVIHISVTIRKVAGKIPDEVIGLLE
jgi:hypothetical protein